MRKRRPTWTKASSQRRSSVALPPVGGVVPAIDGGTTTSEWKEAPWATTDDPCTPVTRLALRVLRPYLADRSVLMRFWEEAVSGHGQASSHAHLAHRWIVTELVKRGHAVWAGLR